MARPRTLVALAVPVAIAATTMAQPAGQGQETAAFRLEETTIAQVHAAMKGGQLTCRSLVQQYLARVYEFIPRLRCSE